MSNLQDPQGPQSSSLSSQDDQGDQGGFQGEPKRASSLLADPRNLRDSRRVDRYRQQGRDEDADLILQKQRDDRIIGRTIAELTGEDPDTSRLPPFTGLHPDVEWEGYVQEQALKLKARQQIMAEEGIGEVEEFRRSIVAQYKALHAEPLTGDPMQFEPLEQDPNVMAEMRNRIAKVHERTRREVDPTFNAYRDPYLGPLAESMQEGNLVLDAAQRYDVGLVGDIAMLTVKPIEAGLEEVLGLAKGVFDLGYAGAALGNQLLLGLTDGKLGLHVKEPTHGVLDEEGRLHTNQPKISLPAAIYGAWQVATTGQITDDVAEMGHTQEMVEAQRRGFGWAIQGIGAFAGQMAVMGPVAGRAIAGVRQGARWLGTMGKAGGLQQKAAKILDVVAPELAFAGYEAVKNGEREGYVKAGMHGALTGALFRLLGPIGRKTESFFMQKKVPPRFARAIGGGLEGTLFAIPTQEGWDFLRDPSQRTWDRFKEGVFISALGMGVLKGVGRVPSEYLLEPEQMETKLPAAPERQAAAARQIEMGVAAAREAEKPPAKVTEAELAELGREAPPAPKEAPTLREHLAEVEKGQLERRVAELSTDPMTGLQTPAVYERAKARFDADPSTEWVTVDLRNLKAANTLLGREGADKLLGKAGKALSQAAEELGISKRLQFRAGGDEFAVPVKAGSEMGRRLIERMRELLPDEQIGDSEYRFGARFGVGKTVAAAHEVTEAMKSFETGPKFREISKKLAAGEALAKVPEARELGHRVAQEAKQELAAEVRGPESPERVLARREQLHERLKSQAGEEDAPPHSGSFPAARGIEAVEGAELTRASDVFRRMQGVYEKHPIKFPIRWRRAGHWAKGWYSSLQKLARMNVPLDLNTGAHEFAHAMQDQTIGLRWKPKDKAVRAEMQDLGRALYGPTAFNRLPVHRQVAEGWAEFWARDLLGDTTLDKQFPAASRFLRAWLAAPAQDAVREQYESVAEGMRNYRDQGSVKRVRASIHMADDPPSPEMKAAAGPAWDRVKARLDKWTDDLAGIRHGMQRYGVEVGEVPITADPYRVASTRHGTAPSVAETFLYRATLGLTGKRTGEGFKQAIEPINADEIPDWVTYWKARIELENSDKGILTAHPREDYLATIEKLGNQRFETAVQRAKQWSDRLIDYGVAHGSISEASGIKIKESGGVYMPLFRVFDEAVLRHGQPPRGVAERGSGAGFREGSTRESVDPMKAIMEVTQSIVSKAHQASVMKALDTLALIEPGLGGLWTPVPRDVTPLHLDVKRIREALEKIGVNTKLQEGLSEADVSSILTMFEPMSKPTGPEAIVEYTPNRSPEEIAWLRRNYGDKVANAAEKRNGKTGWYEVDPAMFKALRGLDAIQIPPALQALSFFTRMVRLGAVSLRPAFQTFNVLKDSALLPLFGSSKLATRWLPVVGGLTEMVAGARAQLKGRNPIASIRRKLGQKVDVDPAAQVLLDAGGKGATFMREATAVQKRPYEGLLERNLKQRVLSTIQHPLRTGLKAADYVERFLAEGEMFGRTREYKLKYEAAKKAGKSEEEAFLEGLEGAREVTQNFMRAGANVRMASRLFPFFSARVGAHRRFLRTALGYEGADKQKQFFVMGATTLGAVGLLNYLLHGDEDWWNDRPSWLKNNYWSWKVGDTEITWPKPHEIGALFSNPIEWTLNSVFGEEKDDALDLLGGMIVNELRSYAMLPTIFSGFEAAANWSAFTGKQIVPDWMEDRLPPEKRYHIYTTWIARQIGSLLKVSPIKVEYLLSQHTGGLGLELSRTMDEVLGLKQIVREHMGETDPETLAEIPFVGRFFSNYPHKASATVDELFEAERAVRQSDDPRLQAMKGTLRQAREQVSAILKEAREGRRSRVEADRMAYRAALPAVRQYRRLTSGR
jgi:GGDEF domain-containing protein